MYVNNVTVRPAISDRVTRWMGRPICYKLGLLRYTGAFCCSAISQVGFRLPVVPARSNTASCRQLYVPRVFTCILKTSLIPNEICSVFEEDTIHQKHDNKIGLQCKCEIQKYNARSSINKKLFYRFQKIHICFLQLLCCSSIRLTGTPVSC